MPDLDSGSSAKGGQIQYVLDGRRRAALADADNAGFSWFHFRVCMAAGIGFFTDAYDIFVINIAATMIGYVYGEKTPGGLPQLNVNQDLGVKVATPVGTLVGQLLFGWLADVVGRKKLWGAEIMVIVVGSFAQALSAGNYAINIVGVLVVWRFFMGLGIGGDYPLTATITSEFSATRIRGRMITGVFAAQGWGNFAAVLVCYIVTIAFKNRILAEPDVGHLLSLDYMWRLAIGLGCIPGVIALYFRLTVPETPRFTMDIERNVLRASEDLNEAVSTGRLHCNRDSIILQRVDSPSASWSDFVTYFGKWENGKILLGTAYSWFALDIAFYGLGLNSSIILQAIGFGTPLTTGTQAVYDNLHNVTVGNLILSVAGLIPGYYATFLFIDSVGRKPIQLMGFISLTILFIVMGVAYDKLTSSTAGKNAFVFLYCLSNFFQNFGANTTTFVIPAEIFTTRYRSTGTGISAACGKLGAIVAQVGFSRMVNIGGPNAFVPHILEILAFFMFTGVFSTLLLPETKKLSLEQLSHEKQEGFVRGASTRIEAEEGVVMRHMH
ncbi:inorganic phosphate transporter [Favolaschia claudopus]|uniref:Inorganic phosphate transporter n=1 Tax=Favolaschia claudopus TaxID=2862362 RepID=A0AAW0DNC1_9AGAR